MLSSQQMPTPSQSTSTPTQTPSQSTAAPHQTPSQSTAAPIKTTLVPKDMPINTILAKTMNRLNTTISITVAGNAASYLADRMPSTSTVLVGTVLFCAVLALSMVHENLKNNQILVSIRSILGITVTTTVMQMISNAGNAQVVERSANNGDGQLLLGNSGANRSYNLHALLLGTVFVIASGAIPLFIRNTEEGGAIYMGIQFAYSDIIVSNITDKSVQKNLTLIFLLLSPWIEVMWEKNIQYLMESNSPVQAWKESLMFAGMFIEFIEFLVCLLLFFMLINILLLFF